MQSGDLQVWLCFKALENLSWFCISTTKTRCVEFRYALMEMGLDAPELPMGMLTDVHLKRCEEVASHILVSVVCV